MGSKVARKTPAVKPLVRSKTLGSLVSASSQDWRPSGVRENLHDHNSPRVLDTCGNKLDSEENSSTKTPDHCAPSKPHSPWKKLFKTWKQKSIKHLSRKSSLKKICSKVVKSWDDIPSIDPNMCKMKPSWIIFSFSELQKATNNFSKAILKSIHIFFLHHAENLIGRGGFSEVYKGCSKGGQLVAVKRLTTESHEERVNSFLSELGIIAHVDHPNIAKLIGYGVEGGLFIVLQLSSLGSLKSFLHVGSREKIEWRIRYKIALGTADGLLYLHEDCQRRIIHRDIKADNILLTENYEAQVLNMICFLFVRHKD
ncbi:Receptor-like cytosolic serine/threonine-protein kinase RBK2 [Bienertia sinuspersici]